MLKETDAFHLTIEEYLLSLVLLIDELARLAVNSVTLGDYQVPLQISSFVKDLHAGFQILNLKNDTLRRRSDSIKYSVGTLILPPRFGLTLLVQGQEDRRCRLRPLSTESCASRDSGGSTTAPNGTRNSARLETGLSPVSRLEGGSVFTRY